MKKVFIFTFILSVCCLFFTYTYLCTRYTLEQKIQDLDSRNSKLVGEVMVIRTSGSGGSGSSYVPKKFLKVTKPVLFPLPESDENVVTSEWGVRDDGYYSGNKIVHKGIDLAGVYGSEVISTMSGTVVCVYPPPDGYFKGHPVLGGMIQIQNDSGDTVWLVTYGHLKKVFVKEGQKVYPGQVIGRVGNTGLSNGAHLHYSIEENGENVNPLLIMDVSVDDSGYVTFKY